MLSYKILAVLAATTHLASAAVSASICANVNLNSITSLLVKYNLGTLCVCATTSGLTSGSLATINTAAAGTGVTGTILTTLESIVDSTVLSTLSSKSTSCTYPSNSIPNDCSGSCGFACNSGYQKCSGQCVANGQTCVSPGTRRRNLNARSRNFCPKAMTACPVTTLSGSSGFECIDTKANLESCGGCLSPFPGSAAGQDCTTIANAYSVECEDAKCVIKECTRGFVVNSEGSACVPKQAVSLGRLIFEGAPLVFSE